MILDDRAGLGVIKVVGNVVCRSIGGEVMMNNVYYVSSLIWVYVEVLAEVLVQVWIEVLLMKEILVVGNEVGEVFELEVGDKVVSINM